MPDASLLIAADRMAVPSGDGRTQIRPGFVRVEDGVMAEVGHGPLPRAPDIELTTGVLAPGLVDLQVNGCLGHDLCDVGVDGWARVAAALPATGVTSFLPTFITAPVDRLADGLRRARGVVERLRTLPGARVLGVHLEGPFISRQRAGAHVPAHIRDPDPALVDELLDAGRGVLRLVTLAPERPGGLEAIRTLAAAGVVVSAGHSDATAEEIERAAHAGARMVTHLFNAQSGVAHRRPGVAAQALVDERLTAGLIADLVHVAPAACRLAFAAAPGRIALVSDALAPAGLAPGDYVVGGQTVTLPADGPPRRADGVLFGSNLRLDRAIANVAGLGIDLAVAIDAATRVPADAIGRPDLGRIAEGARADLVLLDDDLRAAMTWVAGVRT